METFPTDPVQQKAMFLQVRKSFTCPACRCVGSKIPYTASSDKDGRPRFQCCNKNTVDKKPCRKSFSASAFFKLLDEQLNESDPENEAGRANAPPIMNPCAIKNTPLNTEKQKNNDKECEDLLLKAQGSPNNRHPQLGIRPEQTVHAKTNHIRISQQANTPSQSTNWADITDEDIELENQLQLGRHKFGHQPLCESDGTKGKSTTKRSDNHDESSNIRDAIQEHIVKITASSPSNQERSEENQPEHTDRTCTPFTQTPQFEHRPNIATPKEYAPILTNMVNNKINSNIGVEERTANSQQVEPVVHDNQCSSQPGPPTRSREHTSERDTSISHNQIGTRNLFFKRSSTGSDSGSDTTSSSPNGEKNFSRRKKRRRFPGVKDNYECISQSNFQPVTNNQTLIAVHRDILSLVAEVRILNDKYNSLSQALAHSTTTCATLQLENNALKLQLDRAQKTVMKTTRSEPASVNNGHLVIAEPRIAIAIESEKKWPLPSSTDVLNNSSNRFNILAQPKKHNLPKENRKKDAPPGGMNDDVAQKIAIPIAIANTHPLRHSLTNHPLRKVSAILSTTYDDEELTAIYFAGFKFMKISKLKESLRQSYEYRNILHIDYVSQDTVEFVIKKSYKEEMINRMPPYLRHRPDFTTERPMDPDATAETVAIYRSKLLNRLTNFSSQPIRYQVQMFFRSWLHRLEVTTTPNHSSDNSEIPPITNVQPPVDIPQTLNIRVC